MTTVSNPQVVQTKAPKAITTFNATLNGMIDLSGVKMANAGLQYSNAQINAEDNSVYLELVVTGMPATAPQAYSQGVDYAESQNEMIEKSQKLADELSALTGSLTIKPTGSEAAELLGEELRVNAEIEGTMVTANLFFKLTGGKIGTSSKVFDDIIAAAGAA